MYFPVLGRTGLSHHCQYSRRGSPSVLRWGDDGRHYVVQSGLFPNSPCIPLPRARASPSPRRNVSYQPSCSLPWSPAVLSSPPIAPGVESQRGSPTCFLSFLYSFFLRMGIMFATVLLALFLVFSLATGLSLP